MKELNNDDPVLEKPSNFREEDELAQLENSDDIDKLRSVLNDGEVVYRLVKCFHEDSDGVLAATNKRIIFADQRFITSKVVTFKYREIASIIYDVQLVTQSITLTHPSQTLMVNKVDKEHAERFIDFVKASIGGDYTTQSDGRVFRHNDNSMQIDDMPNMRESIENS